MTKRDGKLKPYPAWVCQPCAEANGGKMRPGHVATWHFGKCEICWTRILPVTEPRDFGHPNFPGHEPGH